MAVHMGYPWRQYEQVDGAREQSGHGLPVVLKLIIPQERTGAVIGKGGETVKGIRSNTGSRVKIEDLIPGEKERAVTVNSQDKPDEPTCPAIEATKQLVSRVFEHDGPDGAQAPPEEVEVRLIVDRAFVGQIIGKGGANVNAIKSETGATVRSLNQVQSPLAAPEEAIVQVAGPYEGVLVAIHKVMDKMRTCLAKGLKPAALQESSSKGATALAASAAPFMGLGAAGFPGFPAMPSLAVDVVFRILVPDHRAGSLIGKGGDHLKRIRTSCHAEVHVEQKLDGIDDRMVICKSHEPWESPYCGAMEALLRVTQYLVNEKQSADPQVDASGIVVQGPKQVRLVSQARQMGAVIGMRGSTIKQIASDTRCKLNVARGELPQGLGTSHDELLVVEGSPANVMNAVRVAASLLRGIMIRQQAEQRGMQVPSAATAQPLNPWMASAASLLNPAAAALPAPPSSARAPYDVPVKSSRAASQGPTAAPSYGGPSAASTASDPFSAYMQQQQQQQQQLYASYATGATGSSSLPAASSAIGSDPLSRATQLYYQQQAKGMLGAGSSQAAAPAQPSMMMMGGSSQGTPAAYSYPQPSGIAGGAPSYGSLAQQQALGFP